MAKKTSPKVVKKTTRVSPRIASGVVGSDVQVDFMRNELNVLLPIYQTIADAIDGEFAVKGFIGNSLNFMTSVGGGFVNMFPDIVLTRATRYLPMPNPSDRSQDNLDRYKAYVQRAVFYNVTGRTLEGLVGQIFLREPDVAIPTPLEPMLKNADGCGLTMDQLANRAVRHTIAYGRAGLLVDFPITNGPVTKAQAEKGVQPVMLVYDPRDIINWRVEMIGGQQVLTLVVLREVIESVGSDGFRLNQWEQYRTLKLDENGVYQVEIYRSNKPLSTATGPQTRGGGFTWEDWFTPTDGNGQPLTRIPFSFIGAENNDVGADKPPLGDLALLNMSHYRNSADYEESCFQVGQPTPVATGLTEEWIDNQLGGAIKMGSRTTVNLPTGATFELVQASPNSMPMEAMIQKEDQMVSLGAKLVKIQKTSKTATQQIIEETSESSPLGNISKNVSAAFQWGLGIAASFMRVTSDTIKYALNKDFDLTSMTADDQNAVVQQWVQGAIAYPEMRTVLKRAGTATMDDAAARVIIKKDIDDGLIPDPMPPAPKAPSGAGGPQPGTRRRVGSPGSTA